MSDNYPYRQPLSDTDLRPALGTYSSSGSYQASQHNDFYRPHQEQPPHQSSFSSSNPSSSYSRGSAQGSVDGALGILNSCGLEPSDLSLLAELPESLLTVDSLPSLLQQIKGKRETVASSPNNAPSSSPSSSCSASVVGRPASGKWDHLLSQPVQYPLDHLQTVDLPSEQDRWGKRTSSSVSYTSSSRYKPPTPSSSSSSSRYLDYSHRVSSSDYGKTARDASGASSQDRRAYRSPERSRKSRFTQPHYRSVPPPSSLEEHDKRPWQGRHESEASSSRSSSRVTDSKPSKKEALDFHGMKPLSYPYSCSMCDITVLSEKVWSQHINSTQHADGQLNLLQQFPNWDCRIETVNRADNQSQRRKDERTPTQPPQAANQKSQKKTSGNCKVACVKFPHQSVDEAYLRKLSEPFGKVVKILLFPSLAFVEMGSIDQANDLVKFHNNFPPTMNGVQMEFSISDTFNFLQSSRVVSFSPAPTGEDGQSDLLSIVKRFGQPLYTLFLPSMAYVEMKNAADAEKLVEYYSSNTLRVNKDEIKVSFSGEYKVLMGVPSARRCGEEACSTKRMKSPGRGQEDETSRSKRKRSSSRHREDETSRSNRTRSRSSEKSSSRSSRQNRSSERRSGSRKKRSGSRERRSGSREKRSRSRQRRSRSRETTVVPETPTTSKPEPKSEAELPVTASQPETGEKESTELEAESSSEESDIEGMEVIGEDGENLGEDDSESDDVDDVEKEEEDSPEQDEKKEEKDAEARNQQEEEDEEESKSSKAEDQMAEIQLGDEEEPGFPVEPDNCITLDEVEESNEPDESGTKGICVAEEEKDRDDPEGFIEISNCSEALRAVTDLSHQSVSLNSSKLSATVSQKCSRLDSGSPIPRDTDETAERVCQSSSKSNLSESDKSNEESPKKAPVRETTSENTSEKGSTSENTMDSESTSEKILKKELDMCKTAEEDLNEDKTSEVQPVCMEEANSDSEEKIPVEPDSPADPHGAESEQEAAAGPAEDVVAQLKPSKPVGTEFVRPVVGYFCNLCQVIYADEDEAKLQHCSSLSHYTKYQEITGKDPWTS